jgi:hypothetical protein
MSERQRSLFGWLSRHAMRKLLHITVAVYPDGLVLRVPGHEVTTRTKATNLISSKGLSREIVEALGAFPPRPIYLFPRGSQTDIPATDAALRYPALVATLRSGIAQVMEASGRHRRPDLTFVGAESLDDSLHGYQYEVLRQAAFASGALTVAFEMQHAAAPWLTRRQQDPLTLR